MLTSILDENNVDVGLIERFLQELPEKAIRVGMKLLLALLALTIGLKLIKWLRKIIKKTLVRRNADVGVMQFIDSFIKIALTLLLVIAIASKFGLETTSIITVLGSAGIAVGLALQGSLSNFAGGVLILVLKPFKVGDYIREDTNKNEGTVTEISIFYTKLTTYDGMMIVLPNGTLANTSLTNVTGNEKRKIDIRVAISYRADISKARNCIMEIIKTHDNIIQCNDNRVFVHELADSGVILGIRCFVKTEDFWDVKWSLTEEIKNKLDEAQIEIPYPQLDIHVKNNE